MGFPDQTGNENIEFLLPSRNGGIGVTIPGCADSDEASATFHVHSNGKPNSISNRRESDPQSLLGLAPECNLDVRGLPRSSIKSSDALASGAGNDALWKRFGRRSSDSDPLALQTENDEALWTSFSGHMTGAYPSLPVSVTGLVLAFFADALFIRRVVIPRWQDDDRPHPACFISAGMVCMLCCIVGPVFLILSLVPASRQAAIRSIPRYAAVTIIVVQLNEVIAPLLGVNGMVLENFRMLSTGEIRTPPSYSWEVMVAIGVLKWNFVASMFFLILSPNRGVIQDRRYLFVLYFIQIQFVVSAVYSAASSNYVLELADGSAEAQSLGSVIVAAIVLPINTVLAFMFLVSWRPRWVVHCPDSGATKPEGDGGWSLNADMYLPQPIKLLSKVFTKPFSVTRATTTVFFLGFFLSAFAISGLLEDIDPTGIIVFSILIISISIQRMGIYSRDVVVRQVLSDILSTDGALVMVQNMILGSRGKRNRRKSLARNISDITAKGLEFLTRGSQNLVTEPRNLDMAMELAERGNIRMQDDGETAINGLLIGGKRFSDLREDMARLARKTKDGSKGYVIEELVKQVTSITRADLPKPMEILGSTSTSMKTVIFSDIVGFTSMCSGCSPGEVFGMLHEYFNKLDLVVSNMGLLKYQTVGDAYVTVSNHRGDLTPEENAYLALNFAYTMVRIAASCQLPSDLGTNPGKMEIRVGMHTGPVAACVLGKERPALTFIGDTMNTASRMESNSEPGCVRMSDETFHMLHPDIQMAPGLRRQEIQVKGKGTFATYILDCGSYQSLHDALWLTDSRGKK